MTENVETYSDKNQTDDLYDSKDPASVLDYFFNIWTPIADELFSEDLEELMSKKQ